MSSGPLDVLCSAALAPCHLLYGYAFMSRLGPLCVFRAVHQGILDRSLAALLKRRPVRARDRTWRAGFAAPAGTPCGGLQEQRRLVLRVQGLIGKQVF